MSKKVLQDVLPADCFAHARHLEAEIALLRREMGRPEDGRPAVVVQGAAPRECWFAALGLLRRVDRLLASTGAPIATIPHAPPSPQLRPGHVLQVLEAALRGVHEAKARLGVTGQTTAPAVEPGKTPSDVFGLVTTVDRQLDLLLDVPFSPGDVYQQVSLATAYAARLLAAVPGATTLPEAPFEAAKRPADCYLRLTRCFQQVAALAARSGLTTLERAPSGGAAAAVVPSDCYDLASLVLAEIAFLHAHQVDNNPPSPFATLPAGRRWPAHVFQLAGVLEAQLTELGQKASKDWLAPR